MKSLVFILMIFLVGCGSSSKTYTLKPWPNGYVYYNFSEDVSQDNKDKIELVFNDIEVKTKCIYFLKSNHKRSVNIVATSDLNSSATVGSDNRYNVFHVPSFITERTIYHETFHILGMNHEHQRPDRDEYIDIDETIEITEHLYDTEKYEYEYSSIMHYSCETLKRIGDCEDSVEPTELDWAKLISIYQPDPID